MEIKEIITYEYKTKDGKVFTNKNEAYKHECKLIVWNLEDHAIEVGEYKVLVINTKDDLFKKCKEKGIHTCLDTSGFVDIEKIDKFPCYICAEYDDDYYQCFYKEISEVIDYHEDILNKLKEITKDN